VQISLKTFNRNILNIRIDIIRFFLVIFLSIFPLSQICAQSSFEIIFDSNMHEVPIDFITNSQNQYISILWKSDIGVERSRDIHTKMNKTVTLSGAEG